MVKKKILKRVEKRMITELIHYLKDKRVIILGFGREGKSTYKLIRNYLKEQINLYRRPKGKLRKNRRTITK